MRTAAFVVIALLGGCGPRGPGAPVVTSDPPERVDGSAACRERTTAIFDGGPTRAAVQALAAVVSECGAASVRELSIGVDAWHQGAIGADPSALRLVDEAYALYFGLSPEGGEAATRRVRHGELLWELALDDPTLWPRVMRTFAEAMIDPALSEEHRREAADACLRARRNDADVATDIVVERPPASADERFVAEASQAYARDAHDHDAVALELLFWAGDFYWRVGEPDEAVAVLSAVIESAPDTALAPPAAERLVDVLNRAGREADLASWVSRLRTEPRFAAIRKRLGVLDDLQAMIDARRAEELERASDYVGCATAYDALARQSYAKRPDEALYNAAVCWERAGRATEARAAARELLRVHRDSPLRSKARALADRVSKR